MHVGRRITTLSSMRFGRLWLGGRTGCFRIYSRPHCQDSHTAIFSCAQNYDAKRRYSLMGDLPPRDACGLSLLEWLMYLPMLLRARSRFSYECKYTSSCFRLLQHRSMIIVSSAPWKILLRIYDGQILCVFNHRTTLLESSFPSLVCNQSILLQRPRLCSPMIIPSQTKYHTDPLP